MNGNSPLHVSIANMNSAGNRNPLDQDKPNKASGRELIKMLLDRGANPNQQLYWGAGFGSSADRGMTPFLAACGTGDIELVKLLLEHGANPKLATSDGRGPIIMALNGRRRDGGMAGNARPAPGEGEDAPVDAAEGAPAGTKREHPQVQLIRLLADAGADVKLVGKVHLLARTRGGSALHYAVRVGGNRQVIQQLLDLGLDVNVKDEDGLTALDYAMGRGYVPFLAMPEPPNKSLADFLRGRARTSNWQRPRTGRPRPPIATAVMTSFSGLSIR
jgi:ankyrin repeat protein